MPPVLERIAEQLREDEGQGCRPVPGERDRLEGGLDVAARSDTLNEHRAQPIEQLCEIDLLVTLFGQHLVHRRNGENPAHGVLERLARVDVGRIASLQPQQRGHGLEIVLDRWWISCASTPRITARPCSSATAAC